MTFLHYGSQKASLACSSISKHRPDVGFTTHRHEKNTQSLHITWQHNTHTHTLCDGKQYICRPWCIPIDPLKECLVCCHGSEGVNNAMRNRGLRPSSVGAGLMQASPVVNQLMIVWGKHRTGQKMGAVEAFIISTVPWVTSVRCVWPLFFHHARTIYYTIHSMPSQTSW